MVNSCKNADTATRQHNVVGSNHGRCSKLTCVLGVGVGCVVDMGVVYGVGEGERMHLNCASSSSTLNDYELRRNVGHNDHMRSSSTFYVTGVFLHRRKRFYNKRLSHTNF
jgi:hypothetical protein